MLKRLRSERGGGTLELLFWMGGIAGVIYLGLMFIPVYSELWEVKTLMKEVAAKAYLDPNDDRLKQELTERLKQIGSHYEIQAGQEVNIPGIVVLDQDLFWNRDKDKQQVIVQINYDKRVNWPLTQKQKTFHFSPSVKYDISPVKW